MPTAVIAAAVELTTERPELLAVGVAEPLIGWAVSA